MTNEEYFKSILGEDGFVRYKEFLLSLSSKERVEKELKEERIYETN